MCSAYFTCRLCAITILLFAVLGLRPCHSVCARFDIGPVHRFQATASELLQGCQDKGKITGISSMSTYGY